MIRKSLVEIVSRFDPLDEAAGKKYQFYRDDNDKEPVEIDADDDDDAKAKIKSITKRDPKKVTYWRVTDQGEPIEEDQYDDDYPDDELSDEGDGPDDYDAFITTKGDKYSVSINKTHLGNVVEYDDAVDLLVNWMNKNKYYPTVWMVSDHGNTDVDTDFPWDRVNMRESESMTEENTTSNLDGGYGPPKTPNAFQRTRPTRKDKQKEYQNATSSTGYGVVSRTNKYFQKMESIRKRMDTLMESMVVGMPAVGIMRELRAKTTPEKHQEKIAIDTLKMNDTMAAVLGGPSVQDSIEFLKSLGYTAAEINRLAGTQVTESVLSEAAPVDATVQLGMDKNSTDVVPVYLHNKNAKQTWQLKLPERPVYKSDTMKGSWVTAVYKREYEGLKQWFERNGLHYEIVRGKYATEVAMPQVTESRYKDWAADESTTPKQKINHSIQEVNRKLYEIETMVNRAIKLKTESGLEQDVFWKQTTGRFSKISERMLRISNKLREFNK